MSTGATENICLHTRVLVGGGGRGEGWGEYQPKNGRELLTGGGGGGGG